MYTTEYMQSKELIQFILLIQVAEIYSLQITVYLLRNTSLTTAKDNVTT